MTLMVILVSSRWLFSSLAICYLWLAKHHEKGTNYKNIQLKDRLAVRNPSIVGYLHFVHGKQSEVSLRIGSGFRIIFNQTSAEANFVLVDIGAECHNNNVA
ncbi:hypothetical protein CEXT_28821 [Caerostris extrusa]|uniref:Secreted protein n=1 Tax=Caerostris extrusa TaxID=172846 RepID=A0AAV4WY73_CAEEX|nr:hypothetical protein CEXT_28821 [Caerostris extrusa]